MGIKRFRPITNGLRHAALPDYAEITKGKPEKSLLVVVKGTGGRNSYGRITSRHRGSGVSRAPDRGSTSERRLRPVGAPERHPYQALRHRRAADRFTRRYFRSH